MVRSKVDDSDSDEMDMDLDITGILRRRYPHITLGVLIGATIATIYFFQQVPIYESVLTVLVGQRSSELARIGTPRSGNDETNVQDILATHMELITSRKIIERAISEGKLLLAPSEILQSFKISKGGIGESKNASVLKASFQAKDPELAATVLQSIFDSYFDYIQEKSRNVGEEAAKLISDSLVQCEQELKDADAAYREYIASFPAIVGSEGDRLENIHALRLQKIEAELSEVRKSLSLFRSRHEVIKDFARGKKAADLTDLEVMTLLDQNEVARLMTVVNMNNNVSMQKQGNTSFAMADATTRVAINYEQKLLDLNSRKDQLESTLGTSHPMYRAVLQELANVQEYMDRAKKNASTAMSANEDITIRITASEMLVSYVNLLTGDIRDYESREKELLALSQEESRLAKEIETSFLQSGSYRSRLDRAQKRYDQVFARLQEISLTNSASGFSTDLIVPPAPNRLPVWPSKTKIAALGLLAGGMLGLGLAFLAEMTDRTFRDPSDVEKLTNTSILAHVPKLDQAKIKKNQKASYAISPMIATFHAPGGSASETFRVLRTAVLFLGKKENKKVIMVTSPSPGDGKSTTVSNLAVSLAQAGRKVLLVDGDLRRPTVAKMFGITTGVGLTDYLKETADFQSCCHPCEQENLTICPDGAITSHPAELLQSDRFPQFLSEAREHFDIVLVDAPPVLAVADPAIIGSVVDGCFLTIRIERNNRTLVERACEVLADNSTPLDGVIINSLTSQSSGYGYSSYNYYSKKEYGYVDTYRRYYAVRTEAPTAPSNGSLTSPSIEPAVPKNGHLDPVESEVSKT